MKHVTASKQALRDLKVLACILNFDWENGGASQLEKLITAIDPLEFILTVGDGLKDREKAKLIQEELKADLLPILAPEGDVEPEEAYSRIRKLLRKLNEVESKTEWQIDPIEYEWATVAAPDGEPDTALVPLPPDEVESKWIPGFNATAQLNLLGYRWLFGGEFVDWDFSHEGLYQIVLDAFRSGAIERLRTCPQCKGFFVAEDARQQFCSDDHRNEFNNKQRLQSGYFKDRRGRKRKRDLARARKLLREGKSPAQIAKETKLPLRVLKREGLVH
jgi:hypothetical protein